MALTASEQFSGGFVRDADGREVVTFTLSGSAYDAAVLTDSPVAYWLLNEPSGTSALDASGNGHVGTYTGTYTLAQAGPCTDGEKSVSLNSGYITVPHAAPLAIVGNLTIEAWVNIASYPAYAWIATKDHAGTTNCYSFALTAGNGALMNFNKTATGGYSTAGAPLGAWAHVAIAYDLGGNTAHFYVNGVAAGTTTCGGVSTDAGDQVILGTRPDLYTPFVGGLAKVAIYPSYLSAGQISAHYAAR